MAKWKYTLHWGKLLREAIENEDVDLVVKCLIACYRELLNKLSDEDKEDWDWDIEDKIESLECYNPDDDEDSEELDDHLAEFYHTCDHVMAWVEV